MNTNSKPVLLIVDGAQGSGKSTTTAYLREQMLNTNLMRLSGMKDKSETARSLSFNYHRNVLDMIKNNAPTDMNWVLDRSYISDYVYSELGYKEYDFKLELEWLNMYLNELTKWYDVYVVTLLASEDTFKKRLIRDKAEYETFSVESSVNQQIVYLSVLSDMPQEINTFIVNTDELTPEETAKTIMDYVYITRT